MSSYLLVDKSRDAMEDFRVESDQKTLQGIETRDVLALLGRAGRPQSWSRSAWCSSTAPVSGEHHSAQLLDAGTQQISRFLCALHPRELPPALRAGAGFHGAGTTQVISAGQHQPNDLLVGLGDAEYPKRRDDPIEFYHSPLLVLVLLQGGHEGIIFSD